MAGGVVRLSMSGISKSFPGVKALDNVTLVGHCGEVIGLVGVNGAGKSTLVNILGGVVQPDQGHIAVDGKRINLNSPNDADHCGIAFIHQELLNFASQTVAENIYLCHLPTYTRFPFLVNKRETVTRAQAILDTLGANIQATAAMETLSVGEKQVVEIARALATGSEIVIFDEPTSSLSIKEKQILFDVVRKLREEGKTVIYISHFIDEILDLCDSYIVLRNGKLAGQGAVVGVSKSDIIRTVVGRDVMLTKPALAETNHSPILKVENLHSGSRLKGVSFQLNRGEILGVWGLMGSGRTELIRTLTGLDPMDKGQLLIANKDDDAFDLIAPDQLLLRCGYVTENRRVDGLFINESVWKNVSATRLELYSAGWSGFLNNDCERETASDYIKTLDIKTTGPNATVANLSGGNQQKVILAKWLNKKPDILFLDEPTRGVDVGAKQEIGDLVSELAGKGTATLLVTSEVEEMVALSHRIVVLRSGVVVDELVGNAIDETRLMSLALGEETEHA